MNNMEHIQQISANNNIGIALEKSGDIEGAIKVYEENILFEYPAVHSYDRLAVLYSKNKRYSEAIRVCSLAIKVFQKENTRRAKISIKKYPDLKDQILKSIETEEYVWSGKWIIFSAYPVIKFKKRKEKYFKKIDQDTL